MVDLQALDQLRATYQARLNDAAQAYVEHWGPEATAEADAALDEAGARWLRAIHAAWPQLRAELAASLDRVRSAEIQVEWADD